MRRWFVIIIVILLLLPVYSCLGFNDYDCSEYGMDMEAYCKRKYERYELFREDVSAFLHNEIDSDMHYFTFTTINDSTWRIKCNNETSSYNNYTFLEGTAVTVDRNSVMVISMDSELNEDEYGIHCFTVGSGIVDDKGIIRFEVTKEGIPQGWGQINVNSQGCSIETGIFDF